MSKNNKFVERRKSLKVRFSIGAKLITIISIIVLLSLGSITALVSWLVREDLKLSAEENNFEVNRRASAEAEQTLEKMRLLSLMFSRTASALGDRSNAIQAEAGIFFSQNPQIAAVFYISAGRSSAAWTGRAFVNDNFFLSHGIEAPLVETYRVNSKKMLENAAMGQTLLVNASPSFNKTKTSVSLSALFFPIQAGGGCVLFSSENLNESFGMGVNASYLINADGVVVASADPERIKTIVNMTDKDYIRRIINSPDRNKQTLIEINGEPEKSSAAIPPFILQLWKYVKQILELEQETGKVRYYLAYTRLNTAGCIVITSIEYDKVFEGINATTWRNLYLTAAVLFISIMFIWFFAKSISVPLKALAVASRTIEGGVFDIKLKPRSRDEIGVLASSFSKMCSALSIFGKFTNRGIAIQAMRGQIKPGGLSKLATIFFSDIRGFTEKSENFVKIFGQDASDRIVFWLNEYLTSMIECIEKTNGVVDKFIGDAVMAHWGTAYTAGSPKEDAINCIKAALMMRIALFKLNKHRKQNLGNPPISIGCGINTGLVTAGQIGSELRMEYTVIGDPVNLASRIEGLNKPLATDILITEDTWNLVRDYFIVEEMPPVTVKGKEKPVRLFAVVNHIYASSGPKTLAEVRTLLGLKPADISRVDVNAEERKYKIGGV
ncbi:MAG: HAMP domain-containing protein [Treponema sp.]|jgi:adenylate cyclase|nr:HAMP domain-containing protein [Treponema sp.]